MLHHAKVMHALNQIKGELFLDFSAEINVARAAWKRLAADPQFGQKAASTSSPWLIPSWHGAVDATYAVQTINEPYQVISVDGSQIYPDKHQGTSCYLVNIGIVALQYGMGDNAVTFNSMPYVYPGRSDEDGDENPIDLVNGKRQELELKTGFELCKQAFASSETSYKAFLFDGSLVFWHLASKSDAIKDQYLSSYLALLHQFIDVCVAHKQIDHLVDTTVAGFFLEPYERSTAFKSNAQIGELYPDHLAPYFFYLHVGHEIARIEIPAWIAHDEDKLGIVAQIMLDQAAKGHGYPVALAEAHEQAVVKGPDREFFYQLITKLAIDQKQRIAYSQKSAKKRRMGV